MNPERSISVDTRRGWGPAGIGKKMIQGFRMTVGATLALLLVLAPPAIDAQQSTLKHLGGVVELKSWFNAGKGHPRLIFLLSPT